MKMTKLMLKALAVAGVSMICSSLAQAQATRTWVSGVGDDANPCSRTAPCKTFAGAISKTAPCGEISVLDPGGFGAVTITKAITIDGDGTLAGILAAGINGIIINAGPNDVVIIRSISINGQCSGLSAIRVLAAKHVHIENCTIYDFTQFGVEGASSGAVEMSIQNTSITNAGVGIRQSNVAGNSASINNVRVNRGTFGIDLLGGSATVSNSVVSHHNTNANHAGITAENGSILNVASTIVSNNSIGIQAFSAASTINLANNDVANNTTGVNVAVGGTCNRFQNNRFFQNTTPINGTCNPQNNQ